MTEKKNNCINEEELSKISGGGDYDFIHLNDGLNCFHRPGTILAQYDRGEKHFIEMTCKFCNRKVYLYQLPNETGLFFITEEEFREMLS